MTTRQKTLAVAAAAGLALAGCNDPRIQDNQNQLAGAGVGALAGALIGGEVASDDSRGRLIGGIIGAAAGATIGAQLDQQERALRESQFGQSGAVIQNTGNELLVTLPEQVTFDFDSDVVKDRFRGPLAQLATNLNQFPNSTIQIVGHTDDQGDTQYNQGLSERRARSVANILVGNGVSSGRISTFGAGEFSPVASNSTAAGRQQNRRVVITITPTGQG